MKVISILCLLSLFLGGGPVFNPPTVFPDNLDHLYQLVESGQGNWVFSACKETPSQPYINWSQLKAIQAASDDDHGESLVLIDAGKMAKIVAATGVKFPTAGKLNVTEDKVFAYLFQQVLKGTMKTCALPGEKVTVYGSGVQALFDQLGPYVR